jgi:hypothetical protein
MKHRWTPSFLLKTAIVIVALTAAVCAPAWAAPAESARRKAEQSDRGDSPREIPPSPISRGKPLALITVPENEKWLILVAAPIAAQMKNQQKVPILVVAGSEQSKGQRRMLDQLSPITGETQNLDLSLAQPTGLRAQGSDGVPEQLPVRAKVVRPSLTQASVFFAKSFWKQADIIVAASTQEPEAGILGATLAAHLRVPFIPYESRMDLRELAKACDSMGATTVFFCANRSPGNRLGISSLRQKVEFLDSPSISKRLIELLGAANIHNLILARVPEAKTGEGIQSWMAPYLSLMRGAPVVLCSSSDATAAEEQVTELMTRYSLRPRTVTILADYDSLGTITTKYDDILGDYEVNVEPCSLPRHGTAAAIGVGRIPFSQLCDSSAMIAREFAREVICGQSEPRILMVANPNSQYGSLPFAETVSRITAEEFKNFGVPTKEFYNVSLNSPETVEGATEAHLIIYEGHVSDLSLFQDPCSIFEPEGLYQEEWEYTPLDDSATIDADEDTATICDVEELSYSPSTDDPSIREDYSLWPSYQDEASFFVPPSSELPSAWVERLDGLPVIVLQSCHSLEREMAERVFSLGCVGLVGSVTNVHSASGSAFVKAFCDGLLYRGDTVGEALRDARNYFLCLGEIKQRRGHTETAKAYRAALSFCLWGDPELRVTSASVGKPKLKPVSAKFVAPDKIVISTPRRQLPKSETEKYFVRMFPSSQVAGIVKRLKAREARRLTPLYFFRLSFPEGFDPQQYASLQRRDEPPNRGVFMADRLKRFLYVLYFPASEVRDDEFELRFVK